MKAVVRRTYGGPDHLTIENLPIPTPKKREVLVKVMATTVNRTDAGVITGLPYVYRLFIGISGPRNIILGTDFAGIIEAVGEEVTAFKVGDRVFGFNDDSAASQAEYITFSVDKGIATIPDQIDFLTAAASLEGAHYAINFMNKRPIQEGHKILVNGATGAIGSAMLQLLKAKGLYVTAVCNTKNVDLIRSLGADKIYDYEKEDFTQDDERYDYVFDAVGKSRFIHCKPLLKAGGAYISSELGLKGENLYLPLWTKFFDSKKVVFPFPSNIKASIGIVKKHLENGTFKPVIDRAYPLEEAAEAYRYMMTGQKTGNVILKIGFDGNDEG